MAIMQGAVLDLVVPYQAMTRWDIVCVHTIVGHWYSGKAAHFTTDAAGTKRQHRDTATQSGANFDGNYRVIAIENEDTGGPFLPWIGSDVPEFTAEQCEAIAEIIAWAYHEHGIPIVLCPDSKPGSRGVAYHRQGCDGNFAGYAYPGRVVGGELWSRAYGKVCPGDRRIKQLIEIIIPRARVLAGLEQEAGVSLKDVTDSWYEPRFRDNENYATIIHRIQDTANATLRAVVELANDPDLTPDQMREIMREVTPTAEQIAAALVPKVEEIAKAVLGADNQAQAEEIVRRLGQVLGAA